MKLLTDVEAGERVTVKKIEGGTDVKENLDELGIGESAELTLREQVPAREHRGSVSVRVAGNQVVLGIGMAEKVYLEKAGAITTLVELDEGDKGIVKSFGGGKDFVEWAYEVAIQEGSEIELLSHLPDRTLILNVDGKEIKIGEGLVSKVLVEHEGKIIQINMLPKGIQTKVSKMFGGSSSERKLHEMGIREGVGVTLIGVDEETPNPQRGKYVCVDLNGQSITLGYGMAKKVWVE
jgi:Fe2+ transport system protein FeoA